jgi:hypothetical protein
MPGGIESFRRRLADAASVVSSQRQDFANPTNHPAPPPPAYLSSGRNLAGRRELHASSSSNPLLETPNSQSATTQWDRRFQYVLLCVNTKRLKTLAQVEVGSFQNDQYLFQNIRETYQQVRRGNEWRLSMLIPKPVKWLTQRSPKWLALPPKFTTWVENTRVQTPRSADFIRVSYSTPITRTEEP